MFTALLDRFEHSRSLALTLSVAVAVAWTVGSLQVPDVAFTTALWSALGVSGTAYYLLHYRTDLWVGTESSFVRSFVRLFPVLLLISTTRGDSWGWAHGLVFTVGAVCVVLLFALSFAVELAGADDDRPSDPGREGTDGAARQSTS